ncbi:hypothetical protein N7465_007116 [Penicillium sp. CMV-2018d]|nr:hypothetical protein N7465_007116 [Penicillium sp. CMV-2018d]
MSPDTIQVMRVSRTICILFLFLPRWFCHFGFAIAVSISDIHVQTQPLTNFIMLAMLSLC